MTREELKNHCLRTVQRCKEQAEWNREEPHGKVYEEHKLILELLEQEDIFDRINAKIDEWKIQGKNAELWIVKGNLQVRYLGTIHNIPLPPVMSQPKTGRWIRVDKDKLKCSECGVIHLIGQYPIGKIDWCPNCGTRMLEVEE